MIPNLVTNTVPNFVDHCTINLDLYKVYLLPFR